MPSKKGFIHPQTIAPEADTCIVVHVPNDPAYLAAFWGVYENLGYWWSWERDEAHTGRLIAQRMRESIERTHDTWDTIGDICNMEININCCQSACAPPQWPSFNLDLTIHVGETTSGEILALPGGMVDDGANPPVPEFVDYNGYLVSKCDYANQLANDIRASWENLGTLGFSLAGLSMASLITLTGTATFTEALVGLVGGILGATVSWPIVVGAFLAVAGLIGTGTYRYFEDLADRVDQGQLVCAMYGATNAEDARSRLTEQFTDWGVEAGIDQAFLGPEILELLVAFARVTMPVTLLEPLFDKTDYVDNLPPADCAACAGVPAPAPTGRGTWYLDLGYIVSAQEPLSFTWEETANCRYVRIWLNHDGVGFLSTHVASVTNIYLAGGLGFNNCGTTKFFRFFNQAGTLIAEYDGNSTPPWPINNVARIDLVGTLGFGWTAGINWTFG